jgi:hypothetical protein
MNLIVSLGLHFGRRVYLACLEGFDPPNLLIRSVLLAVFAARTRGVAVRADADAQKARQDLKHMREQQAMNAAFGQH